MTAPQPDAGYLAAVALYQQQMTQLRDRLEQAVRAAWQSLGVWRAPQMRTFAQSVAPMVSGAQQHTVALTAAYLAAQRQAALGGSFAPAAVDAARIVAGNRNGVAPAEVYGRPFHLVWRQLAELPRAAGSIDKAIAAGETRAVNLALDDVQLAKRQTAHEVMRSDRSVVGYRRVLEGPYSCALCIVASTLRYHKKDLMPIHGGCDCSSASIFGTADPGLTVASMVNVDGKLVHVGELPDIHDRLQQRFGTSSSGARIIRGQSTVKGDPLRYRDVLVTHAHGELGPVLGVRGADFVGPGDLAK